MTICEQWFLSSRPHMQSSIMQSSWYARLKYLLSNCQPLYFVIQSELLVQCGFLQQSLSCFEGWPCQASAWVLYCSFHFLNIDLAVLTSMSNLLDLNYTLFISFLLFFRQQSLQRQFNQNVFFCLKANKNSVLILHRWRPITV